MICYLFLNLSGAFLDAFALFGHGQISIGIYWLLRGWRRPLTCKNHVYHLTIMPGPTLLMNLH
jgi:hypothetical protein